MAERAKLGKCGQYRSRERIAALGEVFTLPETVDQMVQAWLKAVDGPIWHLRVLEPSCGTCNFLTRMLQAKVADLMERQEQTHGWRNKAELARQWILLAGSMYGIDIDAGNTAESRETMQTEWTAATEALGARIRGRVRKTGHLVLSRNLIQADFLKKADVGDLDGRHIVSVERDRAGYIRETRHNLAKVLTSRGNMELDAADTGKPIVCRWYEAGAMWPQP